MNTPAIIWQDHSMICPDRIKQKIEAQINNNPLTYTAWYIILFDEMSPTVNEEIGELSANHYDYTSACIVLFRAKPNEQMLHLLHLPVNGIVSLHTMARQTALIIGDIANHGCYIEPSMHYTICDYLEKNHWSKTRIQHLKLDGDKPGHTLTSVEHEILQSILNGETNTDIAQNFHFAQSTVSVKINRLLQKMNAFDRTEAIIKAIQFGWVHSVR